jgi:NAD(P)-dependent dehydrogenase (short-subunit alcohol dehydrogenase family)
MCNRCAAVRMLPWCSSQVCSVGRMRAARALDVNVKGRHYGCRAVIPHMLTAGGGSIVNISSVNGLVSEPFLTVYSASKGAGVMLTKGVALDYVKQGTPAAT